MKQLVQRNVKGKKQKNKLVMVEKDQGLKKILTNR